MKTLSIKNPLTLLSFIMLTLLLSPVIHAQGEESNNGKFTGFEKGHHKGHDNEKGKHKGLENEKNPWSGFNYEPGIDFDLTITNHAIIPSVTVTLTFNSKNTVGEVLTKVIGGPIDGFILQDCYLSNNPLDFFSDCAPGQEPVQMDVNLTLELAGLLDNPRAHIIFIGGE